MPLFGSHFMILLGGMSENTRKPLSLIQQQPSAQSKPSPSTSITAPAGTRLSNAGSSRSIEPMDLGDWAVAEAMVMTKSPRLIKIDFRVMWIAFLGIDFTRRRGVAERGQRSFFDSPRPRASA